MTAPTTTPGSSYTCEFCRTPSVLDGTQTSCSNCGAPVDVRKAVSRGGWVKQPAIKDMARLKFFNSSVQIAGNYVPVSEFNLAPGEWIYFAHHSLLHSDPSVVLANMPMAGGWSRMMAGLPVYMLTAGGPGHVALSFDHPGETIAVPLAAGHGIDVTEHRMLAATGTVNYGFRQSNVYVVKRVQTNDGTEYEWAYPMGQFIDEFWAPQAPGVVFLHAPGNVFIRDLAPGETIITQPRSLIYKDRSVEPTLHFEYTRGNGWQTARHVWLRLTGPGRIAISSVYEQPEIPVGQFWDTSPATSQTW